MKNRENTFHCDTCHQKSRVPKTGKNEEKTLRKHLKQSHRKNSISFRMTHKLSHSNCVNLWLETKNQKTKREIYENWKKKILLEWPFQTKLRQMPNCMQIMWNRHLANFRLKKPKIIMVIIMERKAVKSGGICHFQKRQIASINKSIHPLWILMRSIVIIAIGKGLMKVGGINRLIIATGMLP